VTKPDIESRKEIKALVDQFYDKVKQDPLLGPVFDHVDWNKHLPVMYNFWSSLLFGDQSYRGNPFEKHIPLKIQAQHFEKWLELFIETVDENFSGEKADDVKGRAENIARLFQFKLGVVPAKIP
jgi:hemoglobin